jgi:hypothetical protein
LTSDAEYTSLRESSRSGHSLAELVRRALDERYEQLSGAERLRLVDSAFAGWAERAEDGKAFVERVRSGTARRLRGGTG